jgi:transcriptional regulator with XRE-family HTH domain
MTDTEIRRLFGKNLKRIRTQQGISQLDLSLQTGLTHNFINDVESGKKWLSSGSMEKFSSALKVEPHIFFTPEKEGGEFCYAGNDPYLIEMSGSLQKMAHDLNQRYGSDPADQEP